MKRVNVRVTKAQDGLLFECTDCDGGVGALPLLSVAIANEVDPADAMQVLLDVATSLRAIRAVAEREGQRHGEVVVPKL